jgi:D-beta-D-heptose 7-phosphate kinase / D-beta-D-heptose 1-phosphate adenosyltransferase
MIFDLNDRSAADVIKVYAEHARLKGLRVGLTSGSFDLIHFHHVLYFSRCRRLCDVLIVGVDSDELVRARKGEGRPIIYDSRRVVMVDALKSVDFAFVMGSVAAFGQAAELLRPDIIFKNDTFEGKEGEILGRGFASEVIIVRDVVDHSSTTEILKQAAALMAASKK